MTQITQNIDLVQIPLRRGVREYFLPNNADWKDQVIDKIVMVLPYYYGLQSPVDGAYLQPLYGGNPDIYLDIYSDDEKLICNGLSIQNLLFQNQYPHEIKSKISTDLSRIYFAEDPVFSEEGDEQRCLLLYVYYGGSQILDPEPSRKNVSVQINLTAGQRMSFREIIEAYVHVNYQKIRSITVTRDNTNYAPVFLTLRDCQLKYSFVNIYDALFKQYQIYGNGDHRRVTHDIFPEDFDLDMDYSYLQNSSMVNPTTVVITFEY